MIYDNFNLTGHIPIHCKFTAIQAFSSRPLYNAKLQVNPGSRLIEKNVAKK